MKAHTEYLWFHTRHKHEYVRITEQVRAVCSQSGIKEGMILVSAMHITAGVFVNDNEPGILVDIEKLLEELAPFGPMYQHHQTGENNGDAHLKSILVHHQVIVPVTNGRLDLGPWQEIFYAEFDGQRDKRVIIKVLGE
ncbi:MAG: secondary thiamine-phosphate synthase enzyme YjbQ [Syntrophomonadaceae bacterium]